MGQTISHERNLALERAEFCERDVATALSEAARWQAVLVRSERALADALAALRETI